MTSHSSGGHHGTQETGNYSACLSYTDIVELNLVNHENNINQLLNENAYNMVGCTIADTSIPNLESLVFYGGISVCIVGWHASTLQKCRTLTSIFMTECLRKMIQTIGPNGAYPRRAVSLNLGDGTLWSLYEVILTSTIEILIHARSPDSFLLFPEGIHQSVLSHQQAQHFEHQPHIFGARSGHYRSGVPVANTRSARIKKI